MALIATILVASAIVLFATYRIRSVGRIKGIGVDVYWDPDGTVPVIEIDWGLLDPGDLAGVTVFVKNTKNTNITLLLNSSSWDPPEAAQYLTLDWNYTGQVLAPEQIIPVQVTLYVSLDIHDVDVFSFDIWVWAFES